jgi:hypothetical protein
VSARSLRIAVLGVAQTLVKLIPSALGIQVLPPHPLCSALVAANVFLLGFRLSGMLSDSKEREKLPGVIRACLLALRHGAVAL